MRARLVTGAAACALALALLAGGATACGPDLPFAVFLSTDAPEDPSAYAHGRLGLVSQRFSTGNLVLAYRALRGLAGPDTALVLPLAPATSAADNPVAAWRAARESTHVAQREPRRWFLPSDRSVRRGDTWIFYANCQDDAFRAAVRTLSDRLKSEGGLTPDVRDWLAGQDSVFANCGYESTLVLPPPVRAGAPAWLVHDRAYQAAAARFYAGAFDDAAQAFGRIADDAASPYHVLASYLVARAYTRQGTLLPAPGQIDRAALLRARAQVERVLADGRLADVHAAALRLQSFLDFRLDRPARLAELSGDLSAQRLGSGARQRVVDLAKLNAWFRAGEVETLAAARPELDLADWVVTVRAQGGAYPHALARYRATRAAHWLVAALLAASGSDPAAPELLTAAARVPRASPGYETATLARVRLLLERGERAPARALLDACLAQEASAWTRTAWNLLHALRGLLATDLPGFLADTPRVPVRIESLYEGSPAPDGGIDPARPLLDLDGAYVVSERLPLATLARLAEGAALPAGVRRDIALAAWTRAVVLDRARDAAVIAPRLAALWPGLDSSLAAWRVAPTPERKRFEAAWFVLTHPGCDVRVRPGLGRLARLEQSELYGDRWWPPVDSLPERTPGFLSDAWGLGWPGDWGRALSATAERIVPAADRAQAQREREALRRAGPGANWLCASVLAEVTRNPREPRLPEALHRAVLATRNARGDAQTSAWSKRAFQALHARYGATIWAKRTPYWY